MKTKWMEQRVNLCLALGQVRTLPPNQTETNPFEPNEPIVLTPWPVSDWAECLSDLIGKLRLKALKDRKRSTLGANLYHQY